jgi:LPXTG-site transpeptidase (sortase) family protein
MKVHAKWNSNRACWGGALLRGLEWFFLLFGLAALDAYIWINTSSIQYQAYADWAFDQQLRALTPSPSRFVGDEIRWVLGRDLPKAEIPERPAVAPKSEPLPGPTPPDMKPLASSAVIGRLEIPNLHLTAMVREGADAGTLRRAVGHIPGTALPGRTGNVGLAGHRDTFFRSLRNIQENDAIELQTEYGTYRYVVESTRIVGPRDVRVLASSGAGTLASVVLIACCVGNSTDGVAALYTASRAYRN